MDAYGASQLSDTRYRQLYLFAGSHYQVTKLIDNHYDIGHEPMTVLGVELAGDKLLVILLEVACTSDLQQVITRVHLLTQTVECAHHLSDVSDDRFGIFIRHLGKEVISKWSVDAKLHLLGVNQHNLHLCRMFLVEQ